MSKRVRKQGSNRWTARSGLTGQFGTDYRFRAVMARYGLGALPEEEALYFSCAQDSEGKPLTGSGSYTIHFEKSQLPPVKAFWSVTMYSQQGRFVENPINRYAIGDRDRLRYNNDGSLDIFIQPATPGADKESNWLPAPKGGFSLSLRLYWPGDDVLTDRWVPPGVTPR